MVQNARIFDRSKDIDAGFCWTMLMFSPIGDPLIRPLLMVTKLSSETQELEFRWMTFTKLKPKFRTDRWLTKLSQWQGLDGITPSQHLIPPRGPSAV